jgi:hypothetical protein
MAGHMLYKANIFIAKWTIPKCRNIAVKILRGWYEVTGVKCAQKLKATEVSVLHQARVSKIKIIIFIAMMEYVIIDFLIIFLETISWNKSKILFMIKISGG